jgi:hypothetical protein
VTHAVVWSVQAAGARRRLRELDPDGAALLSAAMPWPRTLTRTSLTTSTSQTHRADAENLVHGQHRARTADLHAAGQRRQDMIGHRGGADPAPGSGEVLGSLASLARSHAAANNAEILVSPHEAAVARPAGRQAAVFAAESRSTPPRDEAAGQRGGRVLGTTC